MDIPLFSMHKFLLHAHVVSKNTLGWSIENPVYEHFPRTECPALLVVLRETNFFKNTIQSTFWVSQAIFVLRVEK